MKHLQHIVIAAYLLFSGLLTAQTFALHQPAEDVLGNTIVELLISPDGAVVCLTRGDSIISAYDQGQWVHVGSVSNGFVQSGSAPKELDLDSQDNAWIAHSFQADKFDGYTVTNYNSTNSGLPNDFILDMAIDGEDRIFFGLSNGARLAMLEGDDWTLSDEFTGGLEGLNDIFLAPFIEYDAINDRTWIAEGSEFYLVEDEEVSVLLSVEEGFPTNVASRIEEMSVAENGSVWFALYSNSNDPNEGGLLEYDGTSWTHYNTNNSSIPSNKVKCLAAHSTGTYFSCEGIEGIGHFDGQEWHHYDSQNTNYPLYTPSFYEMRATDVTLYSGTSQGLLEMSIAPLGILDLSIEPPISVYPNPTDGRIQIRHPEHGVGFYKVKDGLGRNWCEGQYKGMIDLSSLPTGIYHLTLTTGEHTYSQKVVLE